MNPRLSAATSEVRPVVLGIRPEHIQDALIVTSPDPGRTVEVRVDVAEPMGSETLLHLDSGATSFIARVRPTELFAPDQRIKVTFDLDRAHLFDAATEQAIV